MVRVQQGQQPRQWLRLPPEQRISWKEAVLCAVIFGGVLFIGLVLP